MRLLNLQIKKDEMVLGSPTTQRKLAKSPTVSDGQRAGTPLSQQEIFNFNTGLNKDGQQCTRAKAHNLPPLHLDQASLIATPPRVRKAMMIRTPTSPKFTGAYKY